MNSTLTAPPVTRFAETQATTMKAIVQDKYGLPDILKLQEVDKPGPLPDEVLVQVHAASASRGSSARPRRAAPRRLRLTCRSCLAQGDFLKVYPYANSDDPRGRCNA